MLYNIPSRTGTNIGPELLAELAQIEHVEAVKQANAQELRQVEGLQLYAGDDSSFARTLDIGGAGGVCVASHVVGDQMRRMVDEPEHRAEIDASLQDVYRTLFLTSSPTCTKAALSLLGHDVGGVRLPIVEATPEELEAVRAMLVRHGLLRRRRDRRGGLDLAARVALTDRAGAPSPARAQSTRERSAARPAARRPGRDRQEHDRRRARRADRRGRRRPALPDPGDGGDRPGAPRLHLPARARARDRGDRRDARPRGPPRRAAVGAARARPAERRSASGVRRTADDGDGALEARGAQAARGRAERRGAG